MVAGHPRAVPRLRSKDHPQPLDGDSLAETARTWPGALRSDHPQVSFAAIGPCAAQVTAGHHLHYGLGDRSPLGAVNRLDGKVLLLGVGHHANTSRTSRSKRQAESPCHITRPAIQPYGSRRWTTWTEVAEDENDFVKIGAAFEAATPAVKDLRQVRQRDRAAHVPKGPLSTSTNGWRTIAIAEAERAIQPGAPYDPGG